MFNINWTVKITSPQGEPLILDPDVPVGLPAGFRIEHNGGQRRISWRWFSWRAAGIFLFAALWDSILAVVLCYQAASVNTMPWSIVAVMLTLTAAGVAMTYAAAAYLVNGTSVHVEGARVCVRHGPLPWFGVRDVSKAAIERVFCEKHAQLDDDGGFEPQVTYKVMMLLKGGGTLSLVAGLRAPEQALFIERQIRKS